MTAYDVLISDWISDVCSSDLCDFNEFVTIDEFHRLFKAMTDWRREENILIVAGGAHVGELLALGGVYDEVILATVQADDHAFINFGVGLDEERTVKRRVGIECVSKCRSRL